MIPHDTPQLLGMVRNSDPHTSRIAAASIWAALGRLQRVVLHQFIANFDHDGEASSAREAGQWGVFRDMRLGFSTVRKRVSELARAGLLREVGIETRLGSSPCATYIPSEEGRRVHAARGILGPSNTPEGEAGTPSQAKTSSGA